MHDFADGDIWVNSRGREVEILSCWSVIATLPPDPIRRIDVVLYRFANGSSVTFMENAELLVQRGWKRKEDER